MQFLVSAWVNVTSGYEPYEDGHNLAHVMPLIVKAIHPTHACHEVWKIGNREGCDLSGATWPTDVRSLCVGDVLRVETPPCHDLPRGLITWHAIERFGFKQLDTEPNNFCCLEGTRATSRTW